MSSLSLSSEVILTKEVMAMKVIHFFAYITWIFIFYYRYLYNENLICDLYVAKLLKNFYFANANPVVVVFVTTN